MPTPISIDANNEDRFVRVKIKTELTEDWWIKAVEVRPATDRSFTTPLCMFYSAVREIEPGVECFAGLDIFCPNIRPVTRVTFIRRVSGGLCKREQSSCSTFII